MGALVKAGRKLRGVPTSEGSRAQAEALGIPLLPNDGPWSIDVTVDGADEVSEALDLVKGGGAAHTREKIVNYASARNVIIVDESKLSTLLGEKWKIPIEVLSFAHPMTAAHLGRVGEPTLRMKDGSVVRTDAGNVIYDLGVPAPSPPPRKARQDPPRHSGSRRDGPLPRALRRPPRRGIERRPARGAFLEARVHRPAPYGRGVGSHGPSHGPMVRCGAARRSRTPPRG